MDGGGRLLGSVTGGGGLLFGGEAPAPARFPTWSIFKRSRRPARSAVQSDMRVRKQRQVPATLRSKPWLGIALVLGVVGAAGTYGATLGGQYDLFVTQFGAPADIVAKLFGFGIETVAISGLDELNQNEILEAADVSDRNSLLFLSAAAVRDRLKAVPLVKDVTVRKLFPNSLNLHVTEREAAALWQDKGSISVVAGDGVAIDRVHDSRFNDLPFVVGDGANQHLGEFVALLSGAGDLRDHIKAGIYVGNRRWTLQLDTGADVMLPEVDPAAAVASLAALQRSTRILNKDVLTLDLRIPGRVTARLSEDAAAARAEMLAKRPKKVMKE